MFDFYKFFMADAHNNWESVKYHADRKDGDRAHQHLDAMDRTLDAAKQQTKQEIKQRDIQKQ